jgi:putative PIN family toxin of toxin-antitoxin system
LVSEATLNELVEVLAREKLDRYISLAQRKQFLRQLGRIAELVLIIQLVRECRDPKDDKFLEVALNGRADVIITGDADLLRMHPWRDIEILSSSDYLKEMRGRGTRRPEHYDSETKSVARKAGILVGDARGFCFPRSRI